jgi:hypothetical protein
MKAGIKPVKNLACGVVFISGVLCQTSHAQSTLYESGTSILAPSVTPVGGYAGSPQEYLTVSWYVYQNATGPSYTYDYYVNNPAGDVLENNLGVLSSTPEIVDFFELNFNTTAPGAFVSGNDTVNNGLTGLDWFIFSPSVVTAGTSSPLLTFESDLPPVLGNADASDGNPPSPWASAPAGDQVPVPGLVPEPTTMALLGLSALLFLPFRSVLRRFLRQREESSF